MKRPVLIFVALLEGIAVSTIGTAWNQRQIIRQSHIAGLLTVGISCVVIQLVIGWKNKPVLDPNNENPTFYQRYPMIAMFCGSVAGIIGGCIVYTLLDKK